MYLGDGVFLMTEANVLALDTACEKVLGQDNNYFSFLYESKVVGPKHFKGEVRSLLNRLDDLSAITRRKFQRVYFEALLRR